MARAPYACDPAKTRGRRFAQPESAMRTAFQRDRDRIVHARAFRRLAYKTQVFPSEQGDLYRSRLTHTMEVVQLARAAARRQPAGRRRDTCCHSDVTRGVEKRCRATRGRETLQNRR